MGEQLWSQGPWAKGVAPAGIIRAAYLAGECFVFTVATTALTRPLGFEQRSPQFALTSPPPSCRAPHTRLTPLLPPAPPPQLSTTTPTSPPCTSSAPFVDDKAAELELQEEERGWLKWLRQ